MNAAQPKLVTEVSEEHIKKMDKVLDFVNKMESRFEAPFKRWFSIEEAASYIGVSRSTLTQTLKEKIPALKEKRVVRYDRKDLDRYWEEKKEKLLANQD